MLLKTSSNTFLHPPRKQRCNTLYFARKECGSRSLCTPSEQSKMCTYSHILHLLIKAVALSIYPSFHSDKYKSITPYRIYSRLAVMLFLKRIALSAAVSMKKMQNAFSSYRSGIIGNHSVEVYDFENRINTMFFNR